MQKKNPEKSVQPDSDLETYTWRAKNRRSKRQREYVAHYLTQSKRWKTQQAKRAKRLNRKKKKKLCTGIIASEQQHHTRRANKGNNFLKKKPEKSIPYRPSFLVMGMVGNGMEQDRICSASLTDSSIHVIRVQYWKFMHITSLQNQDSNFTACSQ